jgi:hypothetical protein
MSPPEEQSSSSPQLPIQPPTPPQTQHPVTFNQQINIGQFPPETWSKLTGDQIAVITELTIRELSQSDDRRFNVEMRRLESENAQRSMGILLGALITLGGIGVSAYLAVQGQKEVATSLITALVTLVAVLVGKKIL